MQGRSSSTIDARRGFASEAARNVSCDKDIRGVERASGRDGRRENGFDDQPRLVGSLEVGLKNAARLLSAGGVVEGRTRKVLRFVVLHNFSFYFWLFLLQCRNFIRSFIK